MVSILVIEICLSIGEVLGLEGSIRGDNPSWHLAARYPMSGKKGLSHVGAGM